MTVMAKRKNRSTNYRHVALHEEAGDRLEQLGNAHDLKLNAVAGHIIKWFMGAPEPLQDLVLRGFSYAETVRLLRLMETDHMLRDARNVVSEPPPAPKSASSRKREDAG